MGDIFMEIVQEKFDQRLKEAVEKEKVKIKADVKKEFTESLTEEVTKSVTEEVTKKVTEKTKLMQLISLIQKKCIKNKPLSVISEELETNPAEIFSIYDIVFENSDKTVEELYELLPASKTAAGQVNPAT